MVEKEITYKLETIIEYLKEHNGYKYKLYNRLCPGMGKPDSNIVEYAEDVLALVNYITKKNRESQP